MIGAGSIAHAAVEISSAPTSGISCSAGVCTPTAKKAVLNATDLANMLAASDVKITTGSGAVTITVSASFSWTSASRLTLDAMQNVTFQAPVSVAGPGAVSLVYNDGGTGGQLTFFAGGKLDFWDLSSSLVINGSSYTLVGDVATLAGDINGAPQGSFALAADFDAGKSIYHASPVSTIFGGVFEGLGHAISNMNIHNRGCEVIGEGLFAQIAQGGAVRDLRIDNLVMSSNKPQVAGGIAGYNAGNIANVWVSGAISMKFVKVKRCVYQSSLGGVVGISAQSGTILNAHADVSISLSSTDKLLRDVVGGLAGSAYNVDLSSATGDVSALTGAEAGGLLGIGVNVSRSFATGNAAAGTSSAAGGLVGSGDEITNSYSTGNVSGYFAGVVGFGGDATTSYSAVDDMGGTFVGAFFGQAEGANADDYWDIGTTYITTGCGTGDCTGVTGLSDAQLKSALPAGFDKTIWARKKTINNGYPYLIDNPPQ